MPLIVLLAILVAFWSWGEAPAPNAGPVSSADLVYRALLTMIAVAIVGSTSALVGGLIARRAARSGPSLRDRRRLMVASRGLEILALVSFGLVIHGAGWPTIIAEAIGSRSWFLLNEGLVLLPFLMMLLAVWTGLYSAERVLKAAGMRGVHHNRLLGYLVLKSRQALGMVVPVAVLFAIAQELDARFPVSGATASWVRVGLYAGLGLSILALSPAFVRLSWPSRPLPAGPLRDRLERLSKRFGFRYSEILVWDTGGALVNAGVTGALPWFRYVLLTDALVENLTPRQVEAVFGHEVGHISHRHLTYFGLFFLGTVGVMALLGAGIDRYLVIGSPFWIWGGHTSVQMIVQAAVIVGFAILYFAVIFGHLSRRFERQADIFGCRVVSCNREECPPHPDINAHPRASADIPASLCPVGIGIFIEALSHVAMLNGIDPRAASWRHGSIARRIRFLRGLEGRPEAERHFQARVNGLRLALGLVMTTALLLAISTGAMESLR